jgi:hypothetical protein
MKAMIPSREFELRKAQAAALLAALPAAVIPAAAIRGVVIPGAATRAVVTPGAATRAGVVGEVIPQGDNKTPARTLKTTPECSR